MPRSASVFSVIALVAMILTLGLTGDACARADVLATAPTNSNPISAIWNFELTKVEGNPLRVGQIVKGVLLFIAGIFVSRFISRITARLLARLRVDEDVQFAINTLLFYSLLLLFTLYAMYLVNVPLTVFTLMGGALAIGVGFGTQTLINNLISGWVLITERPVGIGDLVEVDGVVGNIERVGTRSTSIRRPDGIHMLVPNSQMLERIVVNWTLADHRVRTVLRVGVIYGSPTDQVASLIRTIVTRNERVLDDPAPIIIFEDFGDDSLVFDVYFWVNVQAEMDLRYAKSDVRFAIDHAFRAAGIVIAFPQRDVHLASAKPLDVRMVEGEPADRTEAEQQRMRRARLGRVDLFESLNPDELAELADSLAHVHFEAKTDIVRQGESSSSIYIVTRGLLEVVLDEDSSTERQVAQLMPGDFFGEMSFLTGQPATATVTALTDAAAYKVRSPMLAPILKRRPEIVDILGHVMAARKEKLDGGSADSTADTSMVSELIHAMKGFFKLE